MYVSGLAWALGPFQTPLHSCAEPNSIRIDFGAILERRLIQTAYLRRTQFEKVTVNNFRWEYMRSEFTDSVQIEFDSRDKYLAVKAIFREANSIARFRVCI